MKIKKKGRKKGKMEGRKGKKKKKVIEGEREKKTPQISALLVLHILEYQVRAHRREGSILKTYLNTMALDHSGSAVEHLFSYFYVPFLGCQYFVVL